MRMPVTGGTGTLGRAVVGWLATGPRPVESVGPVDNAAEHQLGFWTAPS